jgi:NitT/TauT family transport system ATP-binding protein
VIQAAKPSSARRSGSTLRTWQHHIRGPGADRSLIFQQPSLYPWLSPLDNVAFGLMLQGVGRKERRGRAEVTKAFQEQELAEMLDTRIK